MKVHDPLLDCHGVERRHDSPIAVDECNRHSRSGGFEAGCLPGDFYSFEALRGQGTRYRPVRPRRRSAQGTAQDR